jgi:hypothetical protein
MGNNSLYAERLCEIRANLKVVNTIRSVSLGNKAEGSGAFSKVPCCGARPSAPYGGNLNTLLFCFSLYVERKFFGKLRGVVLGIELANTDT